SFRESVVPAVPTDAVFWSDDKTTGVIDEAPFLTDRYGREPFREWKCFFELRLDCKLTPGIEVSPFFIFLRRHQAFGKTVAIDVVDGKDRLSRFVDEHRGDAFVGDELNGANLFRESTVKNVARGIDDDLA